MLRAEHPTLEKLILDVISLDYHETLMAAAGHQAEEARLAAMAANKGTYILVVEGAIPTKDNGICCKIGGKTAIELIKECAADAAAVIPIGSCASWGGMPSTSPNPTGVLGIVKAVAKIDVPLAGLHSTLGRHAARAVMCARNVEILGVQYDLLMGNIAKGDVHTFEKPVFPTGEVQGFGFHEAPRGMLSHWVVIENGKIKNYQAVVPATWNAAPRNEDDVMGPYEASLIDTPLADPERPLEVLRTIHSFDPCLACAVHLLDPSKRDIVQVRAL